MFRNLATFARSGQLDRIRYPMLLLWDFDTTSGVKVARHLQQPPGDRRQPVSTKLGSVQQHPSACRLCRSPLLPTDDFYNHRWADSIRHINPKLKVQCVFSNHGRLAAISASGPTDHRTGGAKAHHTLASKLDPLKWVCSTVVAFQQRLN